MKYIYKKWIKLWCIGSFKATDLNINKNKHEGNMNYNGKYIWCVEVNAQFVCKALWTFDFTKQSYPGFTKIPV